MIITSLSSQDKSLDQLVVGQFEMTAVTDRLSFPVLRGGEPQWPKYCWSVLLSQLLVQR